MRSRLSLIVTGILLFLPVMAVNSQEEAYHWERSNRQVLLLIQMRQYEKARDIGKKNIDLARRIYGGKHIHVAISLYNYGEVFRAQDMLREATPWYQDALEIAIAFSGTDQRQILPYLKNLAFVLMKQERTREAEPLLRRLIATQENWPGMKKQTAFIELKELLAHALERRGDIQQAESLYKEIITTQKEVAGENHFKITDNLNKLAQLYISQGRISEAESLLLEALTLQDSDDKSLAKTRRNLGAVYLERENKAAAETSFREALKLDEEKLGPNHPRVAADLSNLALLLASGYSDKEAEPLMERALEIDRRNRDTDPARIADDMFYLGRIKASLGKRDEAESLFQNALELQLKRDPPASLEIASIYVQQGSLLFGKFDDPVHNLTRTPALEKAQSCFLKAIDLLLNMDLTESRIELNFCLNHLKILCLRTRLFRIMDEALARTISRYEEAFDKDHPDLTFLLLDRAQFAILQNRRTDAERMLDRARKIAERQWGEQNNTHLHISSKQADLLARMGKKTEACRLFERILEIIGKDSISGYGGYLVELETMREFFQRECRYEPAIESQRMICQYHQTVFPDDIEGLIWVKKKLAELYDLAGRRQEAKKEQREINALEKR